MTDSNVLIAGETLVDFVPERSGPPGESGGYTPRFGGAPANVALAMARLGVPPLFWTRLATDDFGEFLRSHLADAGVPDDLLQIDPDARTTLALVTHDADGDRSFSFYREDGADTRLQRGTVDDAVLDDVEWVHTSGVPLSVEPSRSATLDLQARASGRATVSLDPNWRPELWQSRETYGAMIRGALEHVDVVVASRDDLAAADFEQDDPTELARAVTDHGPHTVVVTLGPVGAASYGTNASPLTGSATHPGFDVDPVDTTGAGDAFLAAVVLAIDHGITTAEHALAVGNAAGALTTTRSGAVTALSEEADPPATLDGWPWDT